jgi:translocation and assembly module TamA
MRGALPETDPITSRMHRFAAFRRIAALSFITVILGLGPLDVRAADPQSYDVVLRPTGDAALDAAVKDSSTLLSLKDKTPVGGFALIQRARDDAARFEEAARAFGYYNSTVAVTIDGRPIDDPALVDMIDHAPAAPPLPVTITIGPGPRFHFGQVTIVGAWPPNVEPSAGIVSGQDALATAVVAAQDRLLTALREASYPFATVTLLPAVLRRDQRALDVSFQVSAGLRAALGAISFTGLRDVNEGFLRRHLLIQPGNPFSPSQIDKARQDLLSLGVFSSVRVIPATQLDTNGALPLDVDVAERSRHAVDVGAAWSTDLGANANVAWHHRNLFGEAEQLNLTAAVQLGGNATTKPGFQVGAQFIKPDFLRRDQSLEVDLNAVDQNLIPYEQRAVTEKIGITRKLSPHWSVQAGVLAEQEGIKQEGISRRYNFVGLPVALKYDSTTNLLDPVSGMRAMVSVTPVQSLGGGGTYTITELTGSTYFDLGSQGRSVIALRGLVAQVSGAGVFGIPPDQRLYAGGTGTVRGYRYQSIGPKFADGKPTGATAVSAATVEFRQRFWDHWGAAAFLDMGQASPNGKPFTANWRTGAGAGVRYYTPIGPIRVDFAVPLIPVRGGDSFEVYIGIGQAF